MQILIYLVIAVPIISLVLFFLFTSFDKSSNIYKISKKVHQEPNLPTILALMTMYYVLKNLMAERKRTPLQYLGIIGLLGTPIILIIGFIYKFITLLFG